VPSRWALSGAVFFVMISAFLTPFQRGLFVGDETKYGEVVREMRIGGSFFLPTLGGVPFTHKPPLHFWLIDLLTYALGLYSTWAFVLPSLAAFAFLLYLTWRMGGPLAAFICGTSLLVWGSAQSARMDVGFTAFIVLAVWMMRRVFDQNDSRALGIAGLSLAIATLIKGPMAPVIGIVLFLLEAWRRRSFPRTRYVPAVAAIVVIPLLWFVPAMMLGGDAYTHEVIVKQTVGRAFASWVHQAPPWFYLLHMPAILFPWFLLALAALRGANRFHLSWIIAVLVPYSLMSSKLDVYMMALIPPVALMIAELVERGGKWTQPLNLAMLALIAVLGVAALLALPRFPDANLPGVKAMFVILSTAAVIGLIVSMARRDLSTLVVGIVPLVAFVYAAIALMPLANAVATPQPLVAALLKQNVPPEQMALYTCPHLWSRNFPRQLERVRYVDADKLGQPALIATSRAHANEIASTLSNYRKVDEVRMIGKWFDVYRR
jgi:4-amino-4-deoxy-L-arabinose transferase-like glycosyltransferase